MSLKKQLAASGAWTVAGSVLNNLSSFVVFTVLARLLTPAQFGIVAFATIFLEVGRTLVVAGVSDALVQRAEWDQAVASTAFWTNLAMGLAIAALLAVAANGVSTADYDHVFTLVMSVLALDLVIEGLTAVHTAKLRREFRYRELATRGMATRLVSALVGVGMAYAGAGVWALVVSRLVGSIGAAVIVWRISGFRPSLSFSPGHVRSIAPFALNQLGSQLLAQGNSQAGALVIGALLGPAAIAQYRVGSRALNMVVSLVITPVQQTALSAFSRLQGREEALAAAYLRVTRASALVSCPVLFGMAAVGPDLVALLFGPHWATAGYVMIGLCLFVGPATLNYFQTPALSGAGRSGLSFWATMSGTVGNLVSALITYPFGPVWVAIGQTLRAHLTQPLNLWFVYKGIGVRPLRSLGNIAPAYLCAALMFGLVSALRIGLDHQLGLVPRLITCMAAGAVLYGAALALFVPRYLRANLEELAPLLPKAIGRRLAPTRTGAPTTPRGTPQ